MEALLQKVLALICRQFGGTGRHDSIRRGDVALLRTTSDIEIQSV